MYYTYTFVYYSVNNRLVIGQIDVFSWWEEKNVLD